jgi:hypothetical protein
MKHYILIGSHGDYATDRSHISGVGETCKFVVEPTIKGAEELIEELRSTGERYLCIFNMDVLNPKEVRESNLLKELQMEERVALSRTNFRKFAPAFAEAND